MIIILRVLLDKSDILKSLSGGVLLIEIEDLPWQYSAKITVYRRMLKNFKKKLKQRNQFKMMGKKIRAHVNKVNFH